MINPTLANYILFFLLPAIIVLTIWLFEAVKQIDDPSDPSKKIYVKTKTFKILIRIFAFWRGFLPRSVKSFLDKYDAISEKDIKDQGERTYPRLMLSIYALITVISVIVFLRYWFFWDPHFFHHFLGEHHPIIVAIEHIDVAGLFNGLLGILAAIMIARIVEDENKKEKEELKAKIKGIDDATKDVQKYTEEIRSSTQNINSLTNKLDENINGVKSSTDNINESAKRLQEQIDEIINRFTALKPCNTFLSRIYEINRILDVFEKEPNNILYVMNFSADLGNLRSQNLGILKEDLSTQRFERGAQQELTDNYNKFNRKTRELTNKLLTACETRSNQVNLAFLDMSRENKERKSSYERYLSRALENATIVRVRSESDENLQKLISDSDIARRVTYLDFDSTSMRQDQGGLEDVFYRNILNSNKESLDKLSNTKANVQSVERIPFQFFVTKPQTGLGNDQNQSCLITFSNLETFGEHIGVFAFQSSDQRVIDNLEAIYTSYKNQARKEHANAALWQNFKSMFDLSSDRVLKTIVKFKPIVERVVEYNNAVSLSDLLAARHIEHMFLKEKVYLPELDYNSKEKDNKTLPGEFNYYYFHSGTYFAIGLFGEGQDPETLAEYIVRQRFSNKNDILALVRRKAPDERNELTLRAEKFFGGWKHEAPKDHAIIAKLNVKFFDSEVTVFIVGGVNHFGTEIIADYFCKNWLDLYKRSQGEEFIGLFEITQVSNMLSATCTQREFIFGEDLR